MAQEKVGTIMVGRNLRRTIITANWRAKAPGGIKMANRTQRSSTRMIKKYLQLISTGIRTERRKSNSPTKQANCMGLLLGGMTTGRKRSKQYIGMESMSKAQLGIGTLTEHQNRGWAYLSLLIIPLTPLPSFFSGLKSPA